MMTRRNSRAAHAALALFFAFLAPGSSQAQTAESQQTEEKETPAQATPSAADSRKSNTLKQAVRQKKVLTEDDLHPQPRRKYPQDVEPLEFNPICDPTCQQRVRDQIASDDSSELEFRNKFAVATQLIDDDHKWGNAVVEAVHAADAYCGLERNRAQYAYPNARPPYTADKLNYDFIVKKRELTDKYNTAKSNVEVRIQGVRSTDPFRAVVMQNQWDVSLERACRSADHP